MRINTQDDLINAVWINCMRVSNVHTNSMHSIRHGKDEILPSFYFKLFNKYFDDLLKAEDFFAPVNKLSNWNVFIDMLNNIGTFMSSDVVLKGSLSVKTISVTEHSYEDA